LERQRRSKKKRRGKEHQNFDLGHLPILPAKKERRRGERSWLARRQKEKEKGRIALYSTTCFFTADVYGKR